MTEKALNILIGCLYCFAGQIFVWFHMNSQHAWKFWENKPIMSVFIFGVPAGICFWYGWNYTVAALNSAWSARFIGFGISYLVFPVLTWFILSESMFTAKTLTCILLSVLILIIQVYC